MTPTPSSRPSRSFSRPAARCCEPLRTEVVDDEMVADPARPWPRRCTSAGPLGRSASRSASTWVGQARRSRVCPSGARSVVRWNGDEVGYPIVVLDRVAEMAEVPLSQSTSIALADQNTACVIVSYEVQAHCVERAGTVVGRFGRKGDGLPGEFQSMTEARPRSSGDPAGSWGFAIRAWPA